MKGHPALPSLPPFILLLLLLLLLLFPQEGGVVEQKTDMISSVGGGGGRGTEGGRAVVPLAVGGWTEGVPVDRATERIRRIKEETNVVVSVHFIVSDPSFPHPAMPPFLPPCLVLVFTEGVEGDGRTGGEEDDLLSALGGEVGSLLLRQPVAPEDGVVLSLSLQNLGYPSLVILCLG